MRISCAVLAGLLLTAVTVRAGEPGLANNWKITVFAPGQVFAPWLLKIEDKDGKLNGQLTTAEKFPATELKDLGVKDKKLSFVLLINGQAFPFQFPVPKAAGKKLYGTADLGGMVFPIQLTATTDTKITLTPLAPGKLSFDKARELVSKNPESGEIFDALTVVLRGAADENVKAEDLRGWIKTTLESAAKYGPKWHQETALKTAEQLAGQKNFAVLGQEVAQQLVRELGDKAGALVKLRALTALVKALKASGQGAEANQWEKTVFDLEMAAHKEHEKTALGFEPEKYSGRKKGNRVVVVELFTGAQCPPCVAADLGFDALERTFTNKEVILLQYHLHIPGPDALTTPDAEARQDYYGEEVGGTPSIFFNGKATAGGGGSKAAAEGKYKAYRKVIEPLLLGETAVKLTANAVRTGDKIQINATVEGLKKPGAKVKLRLVLVEEWVRYRGGNGLPYHNRVVRALPGGAKGLALTKESDKHEVSFDLATLRKDLAKFLERDHLNDPTAYRHLSVVAFVQDDATREVLQAIEVPVTKV